MGRSEAFSMKTLPCLVRRWVPAVPLLMVSLLVCLTIPAQAARIKDIAHIQGVRSNQLFGYGLVVGLDGTGDRQNTEFTVQTLANLLQEYHIKVDPSDVRVKNVAAVMVTTEAPPYVQPGIRLDALVSSIGDADSLSGGTLLLTPLLGPDGRVYAVGQGPVSLGGGFIANGIGARVSQSHQTTGQVTNGVLMERPIPSQLLTPDGTIQINLSRPDFTTAQRVAAVINASLPDTVAHPLSPGVVSVTPPDAALEDLVSFVASLEALRVTTDSPARVVVNGRTGTIIVGHNVRISPVAIAHGSLHIVVKTEFGVSQPHPFSQGETVVVPDTSIVVEESGQRQLIELPGGSGVGLHEIVLALNTLGVTPRDLIAVFEALKTAGALQAELVLM